MTLTSAKHSHLCKALTIGCAFSCALVWFFDETACAVPLFLSVQGVQEVQRFSVTESTGPTQDGTITANINNPSQLDFNSSGELFVSNNHTSGGGTGSVARFLNPTGAATPNGFIADNNADPGFDMNQPFGLRFRGDELFLVNAVNDNILRFNFDSVGTPTSNGIITAGIATGSARQRFAAIAPWGELFVSECCEFDRINRYKFDGFGNATVNGVISGLDNPHGMAFSADGELFVANFGNFPTTSAGSVARFQFSSQDENGSAISNGLITGNGLDGPIDLEFAPWGELFVANAIISGSAGGVSRFTFDGLGNATPNGAFGTGTAYVGIAFAPTAVNAIPEPSTFLLFGLGAIGLVRHNRRRRVAKLVQQADVNRRLFRCFRPIACDSFSSGFVTHRRMPPQLVVWSPIANNKFSLGRRSCWASREVPKLYDTLSAIKLLADP